MEMKEAWLVLSGFHMTEPSVSSKLMCVCVCVCGGEAEYLVVSSRDTVFLYVEKFRGPYNIITPLRGHTQHYFLAIQKPEVKQK